MTVHDVIEPHRLFEKLVSVESGYFHKAGIVLRRGLIKAIGQFDEALRQSQNSHYFLRASALGRLYPRSLQALVAMRRIHAENHSNRSKPEAREWNYRMWKSLFKHMVDANTVASNKVVAFNNYFLVWNTITKLTKGPNLVFPYDMLSVPICYFQTLSLGGCIVAAKKKAWACRIVFQHATGN